MLSIMIRRYGVVVVLLYNNLVAASQSVWKAITDQNDKSKKRDAAL